MYRVFVKELEGLLTAATAIITLHPNRLLTESRVETAPKDFSDSLAMDSLAASADAKGLQQFKC